MTKTHVPDHGAQAILRTVNAIEAREDARFRGREVPAALEYPLAGSTKPPNSLRPDDTERLLAWARVAYAQGGLLRWRCRQQ